MLKSTVFIETSVIGYLTSRPSPNPTTASKQTRTQNWWRHERGAFDLFVSHAVIAELAAGDESAAIDRLEMVKGIARLAATTSIDTLARAVVAGAGLPPKAHTDALHIATAAVHDIDYLLTWNCKHIANPAIRHATTRICLEAGYRAPIMCTPEELSHA